MAQWIFIRHGESVANAEGWLAGHRDAPLTARGEQQARAIRAAVAEAGPVRAFSSDLSRARRTAEIILEDLDVTLIVAQALRERGLGSWEGANKASLRESGELNIAMSFPGRPPGGESLRDVAERAMAFLASVGEIDGPTLVVAHGGLLRSVLGILDGLPESEIGTWDIKNTEMLVRELGSDAFTDDDAW